MRAPTHLAFGLLCATCAFSLAGRSLPHDGPALAGVVLGSLLPDLDSPKSILGRLLPFVSLPIERRWGHRTLTHSLLALAVVGLVLLPMVFLSKTAYAALLIGYAAHLLADCATKTGVPLFYPHRARYVLPRSERFRFHSGSTGEIFLLGVLLLLLVLVFPLAQRGGVWKALRDLAGTQGMAYREYRIATTQTRLEFKGQWRHSRQPVQGRAWVLEANQSRFLIAWQGQVLEYGEQGDLLPERSRVQATGQALQVDTLQVRAGGFDRLLVQIPADALVSGRLESPVAFRLEGVLPTTQHEPVQVHGQALALSFAPHPLLAHLHPVRRVDPEHLDQLRAQVQDLALDLEALQLQRPPVHYLKLRQAQAHLQAKERELAALQDTAVSFTGVLYLRRIPAEPAP
ncbi:MAG: metal-dependent hydrolase [Candidatus Latescibacteria bacterium]|nr:metal-dependent hydrolase [Candidatus Latescibacterota bacterium]